MVGLPSGRDAVDAACSKTPAKRVPELDGLRGIAILLVLVFHFTPYRGGLRIFAPYVQIGWIGVDLFFVLSGYLITGILLDTRGHEHWYRNFIGRRSLRIFPLYYAALVVDGFVSYYPAAMNWKDFFSLRDGWWYFGYVSNVKVFLDNKWPSLSILTPLWSLSVEEQFYLLFPLVVLLLSRKTLPRVLIGAVVAAFLIRLGLVIAMPLNTAGTYTLMPCRMDALALGGLIAIARRDFPNVLMQRWIAWLTGLSALTFIFICVTYGTTPWTRPMRTLGFSALDIAFAGLLVLLAIWRVRPLPAFCRLRFMVWTGTISYGIYILHIPAAVVVRRIAGPLVTPTGSVDFFLSIAAAMAAAWISWKIFESPILRLKDRFVPR